MAPAMAAGLCAFPIPAWSAETTGILFGFGGSALKGTASLLDLESLCASCLFARPVDAVLVIWGVRGGRQVRPQGT